MIVDQVRRITVSFVSGRMDGEGSGSEGQGEVRNKCRAQANFGPTKAKAAL